MPQDCNMKTALETMQETIKTLNDIKAEDWTADCIRAFLLGVAFGPSLIEVAPEQGDFISVDVRSLQLAFTISQLTQRGPEASIELVQSIIRNVCADFAIYREASLAVKNAGGEDSNDDN
jgi:hypothetical protein